MRPAPLVLIASSVALAIGLGGCGDDGGGDGASGGASTGPGAGETVTVEIPEFAFDPATVEVAVGDSVVWSNTHDQAHTATGTGGFAWDTGTIGPGAAAEAVEFTEAGTFTYRCALHPFMEGTVQVSA